MNFKILILSDSIALPRSVPELTKYDDSWPALLKREGHRITQCSIGGATSTQLLEQSNYYNAECYDFDIVIIQCGIVDCAPRFLTQSELHLLRSMSKIGVRVIKLLNKKWIKKKRNITYTSETKFLENIIVFKDKFKSKKLFFISIIEATKDYEYKLPGVSKKIENFNKILTTNCNMIDVKGVEDVGVMSDHHHLNIHGHKYVFHKILDRLRSS